MRKAVLALAALTAAAAVPAALGTTAGGTVNVTLKEFTIKPVPVSVTSGKVTFKVRNAGKLEHELVVLKTATAPGKLKVKGDRAVETGRVGEVQPLRPGKSGTLSRTLAKGKYVLLCNVAGHYQAKQFASFVVK